MTATAKGDIMATGIDLTPTTAEYKNIGLRFVAQIIGDLKSVRRADDATILRSLLEIAGHLAATDREQFAQLLNAIAEPAEFGK